MGLNVSYLISTSIRNEGSVFSVMFILFSWSCNFSIIYNLWGFVLLCLVLAGIFLS